MKILKLALRVAKVLARKRAHTTRLQTHFQQCAMNNSINTHTRTHARCEEKSQLCRAATVNSMYTCFTMLFQLIPLLLHNTFALLFSCFYLPRCKCIVRFCVKILPNFCGKHSKFTHFSFVLAANAAAHQPKTDSSSTPFSASKKEMQQKLRTAFKCDMKALKVLQWRWHNNCATMLQFFQLYQYVCVYFWQIFEYYAMLVKVVSRLKVCNMFKLCSNFGKYENEHERN